jgi:hypothetical protein
VNGRSADRAGRGDRLEIREPRDRRRTSRRWSPRRSRRRCCRRPRPRPRVPGGRADAVAMRAAAYRKLVYETPGFTDSSLRADADPRDRRADIGLAAGARARPAARSRTCARSRGASAWSQCRSRCRAGAVSARRRARTRRRPRRGSDARLGLLRG